MDQIESDSYWCFTKIMDKIIDNYTPQNPGVKKALDKMK